MIMISKIDDEAFIKYDYVTCPLCGKGRLCDKPKNAKVNILQIHGKGLEHVVIKCPKCGSRFIMTVDNE